jgi:hypothetical protein
MRHQQVSAWLIHYCHCLLSFLATLISVHEIPDNLIYIRACSSSTQIFFPEISFSAIAENQRLTLQIQIFYLQKIRTLRRVCSCMFHLSYTEISKIFMSNYILPHIIITSSKMSYLVRWSLFILWKCEMWLRLFSLAPLCVLCVWKNDPLLYLFFLTKRGSYTVF